jgi:hypothetical protein
MFTTESTCFASFPTRFWCIPVDIARIDISFVTVNRFPGYYLDFICDDIIWRSVQETVYKSWDVDGE